MRERKKPHTRQVIADTAARLFVERGYEQVAVSDVAREAEVSKRSSATTPRGRISWSLSAMGGSGMSCAG